MKLVYYEVFRNGKGVLAEYLVGTDAEVHDYVEDDVSIFTEYEAKHTAAPDLGASPNASLTPLERRHVLYGVHYTFKLTDLPVHVLSGRRTDA
jgi:hypothetical protein